MWSGEPRERKKIIWWECSRCWATVSRFEEEDAPNFCDGCRGTTFNLQTIPPDKPAPPAASRSAREVGEAYLARWGEAHDNMALREIETLDHTRWQDCGCPIADWLRRMERAVFMSPSAASPAPEGAVRPWRQLVCSICDSPCCYRHEDEEPCAVGECSRCDRASNKIASALAAKEERIKEQSRQREEYLSKLEDRDEELVEAKREIERLKAGIMESAHNVGAMVERQEREVERLRDLLSRVTWAIRHGQSLCVGGYNVRRVDFTEAEIEALAADRKEKP